MRKLFEDWRRFLTEDKDKYIILLPGGYKPPHKGHLQMIRKYAEHPDVEKVFVFVGSCAREDDRGEMSFDVEKSLKVFDLYGVTGDPKVELIRSTCRISSKGKEYENPFADAIDFVKDADPALFQGKIFALGHSSKDAGRGEKFAKITKDYNNAQTDIPPITVSADEISATNLRNAIADGNKEEVEKALPLPAMYDDFMRIIVSS
jgi:hypothetical protein